MNVLYISNHFSFAHQPGAPRPLKVAEHLVSLGHDVTVITNRRHYLDEAISLDSGMYQEVHSGRQFQLISVQTTPGRRKSLARRLANYCSFSVQAYKEARKLPEQDIVIVGTPPLLVPLVGLLMGIGTTTKTVLEIRDLYPETAVFLGKLNNSIAEFLWRKWENALRIRYDHIVAVVPQIKKELVGQGITAEKITVITNGFDDGDVNEPLPPKIDSLFQQYHEQLKIVYGGGMGYGINLWPVLHAARVLHNENNIVFFCFGEGELKSQYEAFVYEEQLKNVFFFSAQPRMVIKSIFKQADVLVHSFVKNDFFKCVLPNKIFEYHGAGTPIIFAGTGDSANLIRRAGSGLVVEPENTDALLQSIYYMYSHPDERKTMGAQGREYITKQYSRSMVFQKWSEVLLHKG